MTNLSILRRKLEAASAAQTRGDRRYLEDRQAKRNKFIEEAYISGGRGFLERVRKYGCTEKGDKVKLDPWFEEYLLLIGDLRLQHTLTTGCAQLGKAQPLDAKVLTPSGWVYMGELVPGSQVIAGDGSVTTVMAVFPQGVKDIYRVTLDDGSSTECCDEHLWLTQTADDRRIKTSNPLKSRGTRQRDWEPTELSNRPGTVKSLSEIRETLYCKHKDGRLRLTRKGTPRNNHNLPIVGAVQFEAKPLPVDPYLLGVLLGDGGLSVNDSLTVSSADEEILEHAQLGLPVGCVLKKKKNSKYDYAIVSGLKGYHLRAGHPLINSLRELGVMEKKAHQKFIPHSYQFSDVQSRIALLQGLLDTDGTVGENGGSIEFCSASYRLIQEVRELVLSLGGLTTPIKTRIPTYRHNGESRQGAPSYRLIIRLPNEIPPFRLTRKLDRCVEREPRRHRRYIQKIEPVGKKEAQCILIDHPSHLYVTDDYIVTHNTLGHTMLMVDGLTTGKLNVAWFYDSRTNLDANVPMQFHPVADFWIAEMQAQGHRFRRGRDRTINTRYQVEQVNAIFSYVSTSRPSAKDAGRAAAGGAVVSFQADMAFLEERSQYPPGAADPIPRRLDASMLPTRPIRELGTPGGGQGIEAEINDVDHYFYPHFECERCKRIQPLDPKGALLRPTVHRDSLGRPKVSYLSESGRPATWFHSDPNDPVGSAYFGCPNCGYRISDEQRYAAHFRCRYTGISALEFLESLPPGVPDRNWKIGVHISPLTRFGDANLASGIIKSGFDAVLTEDWQQQRLGHASESQANSISLEMMRFSMLSPKPERKPDFTLAGIDIGRSEDWLVIIDYFLPDHHRLLVPAEISEKTIRSIRFAAGIVRDSIPDLLQEFSVEYGLVDNEPSRESSMKLCQDTCLEMADQYEYLKDVVQETVVQDGGLAYKCWNIRNAKFMGVVLEGFLLKAPDGHALYRLPTAWEKWIGNPSDLSPLTHLAGPWRDPDGRWHRAKNKVDDMYMACVFAEAAFYLKLVTPMPDYTISSAGSRPIRKILNEL